MAINFGLKQIKISRDQKWSFLSVAVIVICLVFTLNWVTTQWSNFSKQDEAIKSLQKDKEILEQTNSNIAALKESFEEFNQGYALGEANRRDEQVTDAVLLDRALPSQYTPLQFRQTLGNFQIFRGYEEAQLSVGGASGSDTETTTVTYHDDSGQEHTITGVNFLNFSFSFSEIPLTCANSNSVCVGNFLRDLDLLIYPTRIKDISINYTVDDNGNTADTVQMNVSLETYYKPDQTFIFTEQTTVVEGQADDNSDASEAETEENDQE